MSTDRVETLGLIDEAVSSGCRMSTACRELGISPRSIQRWRLYPGGGDDMRQGPMRAPKNKLSAEEREEFIRVANSPDYRNLSPKTIVPKLADQGIYIASESTLYRILREKGLLEHRGETSPRSAHRPEDYVAGGPNQVWSWDITYLPASIRGTFYYLYMFVDVWSRRIMKAVVAEHESSELAAQLLAQACKEHGIALGQLVLHSDNGGPMKGATMLETMRSLGVVSSFSRPSVSNDNPYSESLFRTLKYIPGYPRKPFASVDAAWAWVERFVAWYNGEHLHSSIGFVTPNERHQGLDRDVIAARREVYAKARERHPERWSRQTRQWDAPALVTLNPRDADTKARAALTLRLGASETTSKAPAPDRMEPATDLRRSLQSAA